MRHSSKQEGTGSGHNQVFGVDLHDFIQKQENQSNFELADEFGLSLKDVKVLKQKMSRN